MLIPGEASWRAVSARFYPCRARPSGLLPIGSRSFASELKIQLVLRTYTTRNLQLEGGPIIRDSTVRSFHNFSKGY